MEKRILCFGDSNTFGFDATTGQRFGPGVRWTSLVQQMLGEGWTVIEEGLGGRTATMEDPIKEGLKGIDYFVPCLDSHKPLDVVVIMLGTNDAKERFSLTPRDMALCTMRLAQKIRFSGAGRAGKDPQVLLVSPPPVREGYEEKETFHSLGAGAVEKTTAYPKWLKEFAPQGGFAFVEAGAYLSMGEEDCMHLDEKGHEVLAHVLEEKIKELVKS